MEDIRETHDLHQPKSHKRQTFPGSEEPSDQTESTSQIDLLAIKNDTFRQRCAENFNHFPYRDGPCLEVDQLINAAGSCSPVFDAVSRLVNEMSPHVFAAGAVRVRNSPDRGSKLSQTRSKLGLSNSPARASPPLCLTNAPSVPDLCGNSPSGPNNSSPTPLRSF